MQESNTVYEASNLMYADPKLSPFVKKMKLGIFESLIPGFFENSEYTSPFDLKMTFSHEKISEVVSTLP